MLLAHRRGKLGFAVTVSTLAALAACSFSPEPTAPRPNEPVSAPAPTGEHYEDQRAGFALTLPAGFLRNDTSDDPRVTAEFTLPGEGPNTVRATMSIVVTPHSDDLPTLITKSRGLLQVALKDYRPTHDEPITLPSGTPGWLLGGSYLLQKVPARNIQLYLVDHNTSYVITGVTTKTIFDQFEPAFRGVFNTVTVR
jgi:hypothetical protein